MAPEDSARISPTAHYTSYVWVKHGLSNPALATPMGQVLHGALAPMNAWYERRSRGPSLDMMLLARHRTIDFLLARAIAEGRVSQVIEIAAGLSARGLRFTREAGRKAVRYIEADLPDMAREKRRRLSSAGLLGKDHEVVEIDALTDDGERSLDAVSARHLDPSRGTAIITEGLLGYVDRASVVAMWRRFARTLSRFPEGLYLSDLNLSGDVSGMRSALAFRRLLEVFSRGRVHLHYRDSVDVEAALLGAGFAEARVHLPTDFPEVDVPGPDRRHVVRVLRCYAANQRERQ